MARADTFIAGCHALHRAGCDCGRKPCACLCHSGRGAAPLAPRPRWSQSSTRRRAALIYWRQRASRRGGSGEGDVTMAVLRDLARPPLPVLARASVTAHTRQLALGGVALAILALALYFHS